VCVATMGTEALIVARADDDRFRGTAAIEQRVAFERSARHKLRSASSRNAIAAPTIICGHFQLGGRALVSRFDYIAALAGGEAFRRSGGSGQCLHMRVMDWGVHVRADRTDCARTHVSVRREST
jgi:hypothetical protein